MAKQTFTTGQVLTAAQMNSLQANDYNWTVDNKTANYTLVAGDAGKRIVMDASGATTITVNTSIFTAGDVVWIHNINTGTCTVTAGTCTVNTAGSLALAQWDGGALYFTSASSAIWFPTAKTVTSKVVQIVTGSTATQTSTSLSTYVDTTLTATITPTSASNQVLVVVTQNGLVKTDQNANNAINLKLLRGSTEIQRFANSMGYTGTAINMYPGTAATSYLDSPATTSATTYKTTFANDVAAAAVRVQDASISRSTIVLYEVTP